MPKFLVRNTLSNTNHGIYPTMELAKEYKEKAYNASDLGTGVEWKHFEIVELPFEPTAKVSEPMVEAQLSAFNSVLESR